MDPSSACPPWKNCKCFCDTLFLPVVENEILFVYEFTVMPDFVFAPLTALIKPHTFLKMSRL